MCYEKAVFLVYKVLPANKVIDTNAENFIPRMMHTWLMGSRWYTSEFQTVTAGI